MDVLPEFGVLISFLIACWVLQLSPGPDMMVVISNSLNRGVSAGIFTVLGIFSGIIVQAPLLVLGTTKILESYDGAFDVIRSLGAAYLAYLAFRSFRNIFKPVNLQTNQPGRTKSNSMLEGFITNVSNPKVLVFLFAFIPQFTDPAKGSVGLQMFVLLVILKFNGLFINGSVAIVGYLFQKDRYETKFPINIGALLSTVVYTAISVTFFYQILFGGDPV